MKKGLIIMCACVLTGCAELNDKDLPRWLNWLKKESKQTVVDNRVAVKTAMALAQTIPQDVEFTAGIEPWQKNYIVPALQGARIDRIYVNVSDKVKKGQLVAQMDPTQYNTARVQAETARSDYNRIKRVFDAGGVSAQQLQQARAQYQVYAEALANVAKNVKLYSPIDGVVTQKYEEEGNLFTSTPILEIMQMDKLKVQVAISEQYFANVKVGTPVEISVDVFPGEVFPADVSLVYPAIDAATRTFTVEIAIPNKNNRLRPGMFARSVINMGDKEAVMVPDVAVQKQIGTNERYVYVVEDGKAQRRSVTPGRQVGEMMDILSGVEANEQVITTSFTRLNEGTEIIVTE